MYIIKNDFDLIICESPPIFLGISALLLKYIKKVNLLFNVSDLWPRTIEELGLIKNRFLLNITKKLEESIYINSDLITGQTKGIVMDIRKRMKSMPIQLYRNGFDFNNIHIEKNSTWRRDNGYKDGDVILMYGGIMGHSQGLDVILDAAKILEKYASIKFLLVGDGAKKECLIQKSKQLKLSNIKILDSVNSDKYNLILNSVDIGIVHLLDLKIFEGAIPSKIFELMAYKIPIIMGINGESKELFYDEGKCVIYFQPEKASSLAKAILNYFDDKKKLNNISKKGYAFCRDKFDRDIINYNFAQFIRNNKTKMKY
tara:strand:- start:162 stop:1103 length:942 start_codon:yes stop_codon:yes gene_type:complete